MTRTFRHDVTPVGRWRPTPPPHARPFDRQAAAVTLAAVAAAVLGGSVGYKAGHDRPSGFVCPGGIVAAVDVPRLTDPNLFRFPSGLWFSDGAPVGFSATEHGDLCLFGEGQR